MAAHSLNPPTTHSLLEPLEMTFVEGYTFVMVDVIEEENDVSPPLQKVIPSDFNIGTFEITYRQYDTYASATGGVLPP